MIVRNLEEARKTERRVVSDGWESTRLLLKGDKMGFSFHITTIYEGAELNLHYKNHLESVYCISGEGEVETIENSKIYPLQAGSIYILDKNDKHILRAKTEMQMACVFNPALNGQEVHDESGSYLIE